MRKLVYLVASTIDGYLQYLTSELPETLPGPARDALGITAEGTHFDTVLEGRNTFEVGVQAGIPDAYPHLRHIVFSRTLGDRGV